MKMTKKARILPLFAILGGLLSQNAIAAEDMYHNASQSAKNENVKRDVISEVKYNEMNSFYFSGTFYCINGGVYLISSSAKITQPIFGVDGKTVQACQNN